MAEMDHTSAPSFHTFEGMVGPVVLDEGHKPQRWGCTSFLLLQLLVLAMITCGIADVAQGWGEVARRAPAPAAATTTWPLARPSRIAPSHLPISNSRQKMVGWPSLSLATHVQNGGEENTEAKQEEEAVADQPATTADVKLPDSSRRPLHITAALLLSAGLAASMPHVQVALETAKSVFAGGSNSLLHAGAYVALSEQQELLINLVAGFLACCVSATLTYPIDTMKTRLQAKDYKEKGSGFLDLYKGLLPALATICPSASLFVAMSFFLKRLLLGLPFLSGQWSVVATLLSGAICNGILSLYRVPSDMMIKLIQTDVCATVPQALTRIFRSRGALKILLAVWTITLFKTVPYGALKIGVYEVYELLLGSAFARWGFSKFMKSMLCGAISGVTTGLLTTPIDVVMTRLLIQVHDMTNQAAAQLAKDDPSTEIVEPVPISSRALFTRICSEIYEERGIGGFFVGAFHRACYYAPSSCSFFAVFETLRVVFIKALSTA
eukprot:GGOE01003058.1.p1 GENE.GGOE01003058.1~~GGOE01003058.1.p1  ORF type:complete len:516 (-),score=164.71 GGOE01003058.1:346-1830(-)